MTIVANGCPKSGTHALMQVLAAAGGERLPGIVDGMRDGLVLRPTTAFPDAPSLDSARAMGNGVFVHGHVPVEKADMLDGLFVVTIKRDPRAVAVSYARWRGVSVVQAITDFFGQPLVEWYRAFLGWERFGPVLRYEDIEAFAIGLDADLYAGAEQNHDTRTGDPSDWRDWWSYEVEAAWSTVGGPRLVEESGYA